MALTGYVCMLLSVAGLAVCNPIKCTHISVYASLQVIYSHPTYGSENYVHNVDHCWLLSTHDNTEIIKISRSPGDLFQLQYGTEDCLYDKLQIEDLSTANGQIIKFCGTDIFDDLYSSGPSVRIRFITDGLTACKGFKIGVEKTHPSWYNVNKWKSNYYFYGNTSGTCIDGPKEMSNDTICNTLSLETRIWICVIVLFCLWR